MGEWKGWDKIKYEEDLNPSFADEIASFPGGDKLWNCIQCGTCSGVCPLSTYMDYTPRKIVAMIRAGFKGEVLKSHTTWLCASCYSCTVECPKGIKITDIMYAAKRLAIKEGVYPKRFPIPVLAREFYGSVEKTGRSNEGPLIVQLYLKTKPWQIIRLTKIGLRLLMQGRMSMMPESIKRKEELQKLLGVFEKEPVPIRRKTPHAVSRPKEVL